MLKYNIKHFKSPLNTIDTYLSIHTFFKRHSSFIHILLFFLNKIC
jgi:hypothetical protein